MTLTPAFNKLGSHRHFLVTVGGVGEAISQHTLTEDGDTKEGHCEASVQPPEMCPAEVPRG